MRRVAGFPTPVVIASLLVVAGALPRPARAQTYEVLHAFEQPPKDARSELCFKDGELYGVTLQGGEHNEGTLFKVTSDGQIQVLHSFGGPGASLRLPWGGLTFVPSAEGGAFFGTTAYGGAQDLGAVFRMPPGGTPEVVHSFDYADGYAPQSTLLAASDGHVYGNTSYGGASGTGTLFRFDPGDAAASFQTFHSLPGTRAGQNDIAEGPDGLYLAAYASSGYVTGEVYKISTGSALPSVTKFAEIRFTSADDFVGYPVGVVADSRALYVTTRAGYSGAWGAVFRIPLGTGVVQVLHRFALGDGGHDPATGPAFESESVDASGTRITRLVGTTNRGGANGGVNGTGTAFRLEVRESSGSVTSSFQKIDDFARPEEGYEPQATLVKGPGGDFFGTTWGGAMGERGSVFRLSTMLEPIATFARPRPGLVGSSPASLSVAPDRNALLGITWEGGDAGQGTAFRFDPAASSPPNVIAPFEGESPQGFEGFSLQASRPVRVGDDYYSTLEMGGSANAGSIVRVSPAGSVIETVYEFQGSDGRSPQELVLGPDGRLYGAARYADGPFAGTIFAFDPATRTLDGLWAFGGSQPSDGFYPNGPLVFDENGAIYGTTYSGGLNYNGTVFSLHRTATSWELVVLRRLNPGIDGSSPAAGLLLASDGRLYGTTYGNAYNGPPPFIGTVFRMNRDGSGFEMLHAFTGDLDACSPEAPLVAAPDGWLYGTTRGGYFCQLRPGWWGSLFRVDPRTGVYETLHTFDREDGGTPLASLLPMPDGSLVGTATYGGPRGGGVLFRLASARVDPGGPYTVPEGGSVVLTATCACPGPVAFAWDLDSDGTLETSGSDATFSPGPQGGPGSLSVRLRAVYGTGIEVFADADLTITNVAPTVDAGPDASLIVGETLSASGSFADPGPDTWTATVDYGVGGPVGSLALAGKAFTLSHTYATPGTFTVTVSVSDGNDSGRDTLVVTVASVEDSIQGLIEQVRRLIGPPGPLNGGQGNSLISKLEGVLDQLTRGNVTSAINKLEAFVNEVEAYIASGRLTEAEGRPLVLAANRILAALR